jgi:hypothetical protein
VALFSPDVWRRIIIVSFLSGETEVVTESITLLSRLMNTVWAVSEKENSMGLNVFRITDVSLHFSMPTISRTKSGRDDKNKVYSIGDSKSPWTPVYLKTPSLFGGVCFQIMHTAHPTHTFSG